MQIREILTVELKQYEHNPRINDKAVKVVAKSIEKFGFKVPLVIDAENIIVCGHTRLKAAQKLGLKSVPCIVADDLTPEQIKAFRLVDNKTAELAEWDFAKLIGELQTISSELADEFTFELPAQYESPPVNISLPTKPTSDYESITFVFANAQKQAVESALVAVAGEVKETFGNKNQNGNALYEVVRQWAEQKKLS